jgi:hypothetical protein
MSNTLDRSQLKFDRMPDIAGDPIVESGSNADGDWTRWADGTQSVTNELGISGSNTTTWTFPISFVTAPVVMGMGQASGSVVVHTVQSTTTVSVGINAWDAIASSVTRITNTGLFSAIGRWK